MSKNKKKIMFITGTRADYGKLKSLMKEIEKNELFELFIFVSGMHLLKIFGSTYDEIVKDGYKNIYIAYGLYHSDKMSINLGNTISQLTGYVDNIKPDMIVVHGDRIDALAGAVVGALNNILVSHIEGGEISGTIDESIRHSITKFAHLHFVSNSEAQKRLVQLGEKSDDIFIIGSPDIDIMMKDNLPTIEEVKIHYNITFDKYALFMYHPVTTEYVEISKKIKNIVDAVIESNLNYIIIYPNNDLGSEIILNEYTRLNNKQKFLIYPSLRFESFLTLLKNADFMIGNSSAGIRETCVYGIPAIDIGSRQNGRYNLNIIKNIQKIKENKDEILLAINNSANYRIKQQYFGDGTSKEKFIKVLESKRIWENPLQKKFIDIEETN